MEVALKNRCIMIVWAKCVLLTVIVCLLGLCEFFRSSENNNRKVI